MKCGATSVLRRQSPESPVSSVFRELPSCSVCFSVSAGSARDRGSCCRRCRRRSAADARFVERETQRDKKCLLLLLLPPYRRAREDPFLRMADDSHENGTSNGDVPEIELIIKVSTPRAAPRIERELASETRGRKRGKDGGKRRRSFRGAAMGVDSDRFSAYFYEKAALLTSRNRFSWRRLRNLTVRQTRRK